MSQDGAQANERNERTPQMSDLGTTDYQDRTNHSGQVSTSGLGHKTQHSQARSDPEVPHSSHPYRWEPISEVFDYIEPRDNDESRMYGVRFSHAHPTGDPFDPNEKHAYDSVGAMQERKKIHLKEMFKGKKNRFMQKKAMKMLKWTVMGLVGSGIVGAIIVSTYFRLGQKKGSGFLVGT